MVHIVPGESGAHSSQHPGVPALSVALQGGSSPPVLTSHLSTSQVVDPPLRTERCQPMENKVRQEDRMTVTPLEEDRMTVTPPGQAGPDAATYSDQPLQVMLVAESLKELDLSQISNFGVKNVWLKRRCDNLKKALQVHNIWIYQNFD